MASTPLSPRTVELVDAMFAAGQRHDARRLLEEEFGTNLPLLSGLDPVQLERYRFAAIRISHGDLKGLESAIALAKTDWRDLLMEADFAKDTQAHERWFAVVIPAGGPAA